MAVELAGPADEVSPGAMLAEIDRIAGDVRLRRQAYWLPLLVFGLLTCASAPLYVRAFRAANDFARYRDESENLGMLGGLADSTLMSTSTERAVYWLAALIVGALVTGLWYAWHGAATGVRSRPYAAVAVWVGGAVGLVVVSVVVLDLTWQLWPLTSTGTTGLFVIALGLLVLAWIERSLLCTIIAAAYLATSPYSTFWTPENLLYRILHDFGVADRSMPFEEAMTVDVLMPGVVLVLGGLVALAMDVRRR